MAIGRGVRRGFQKLKIIRVDPVTTDPVSVEPDPIDETPDAFSFTAVTGAVFGSTQTSNPATISGLSDGVSVTASISGDATSEMLVTHAGVAGAWGAGPVLVENGDTVAVRHTAALFVSTTLTVGGVSASFTSTTTGSSAGQAMGILLAITKAS